jgi:catechol 2,3-dioxygenase-like lactoylglutathione lyase family enzyme
MITCVRSITLYVRDQQKAVDFYVGKLGFEKRRDEPMGPEARWIELVPPGAETVLVPFTPPGSEDKIGTFSGLVFDCDDIEGTYRDLTAKGVEFTHPPQLQPWGMKLAQFKDPDGNGFVLVQSR